MTTPPLPELTAIMATSDRFPDGTYGATVSVGEDVSYSLPGPRARRYATAIIEAATTCEHDAALYHALMCKEIGEEVAADLITEARAARPGVHRWTAPLRLTPILTAAAPHLPKLVVEADGGLAWQWTPVAARQHARQVLECVTAAEEDNRLAVILRGKYGLEEDVVAAVINHLTGHWPDDEDR